MKLLLGFLFCILGFVSFVSAAESKVISIKRQSKTHLIATLLHKTKTFVFDFIRDDHMFSPNVTVDVLGQNNSFGLTWRTQFTYLAVHSKEDQTFATCVVDTTTAEFSSGIFSIHGELFFLESVPSDANTCGANEYVFQPLSQVANVKFEELIMEIPGVETSIKNPNHVDANAHKSFQISIATDESFLLGVVQDGPASLPENSSRYPHFVLLEIERMVGFVRALFLARFNLSLEIHYVVIGGGKDAKREPVFFKTCLDWPALLVEGFAKWSFTQPHKTGQWMFLTSCFPNLGASFLHGACQGNVDDKAYNVGVVSWQVGKGFGCLPFAQEIMHTFGVRSLSDDIQLNVPRFDTCEFVTIHNAPLHQCGNEVLELGEECECLNGAKRCGNCVECVLKRKPWCTTKGDAFVVRHKYTPPVAPVSDVRLFSHEECCVVDEDGLPAQLVPARLCNNNKGVCSPTGTCEKACQNFGLPPCGFDETGCVQLCYYEKQCQGEALKTHGPPAIPVGAMPEHTTCITAQTKVPGTCNKMGECIATPA